MCVLFLIIETSIKISILKANKQKIIPMGNQCVLDFPASIRADVTASLIAKAITTPKHIGGSPMAEMIKINLN